MKYTLITSENPPRLSKLWKLDSANQPVKEAAGNMSEGTCEIIDSPDLNHFAGVLSKLGPDQALAYGLTKIEKGKIYSRSKYVKKGRPVDACTRTKQEMRFPDGPAVFFIDYDPPKDSTEVYSHEELWEILCKACPGLKGVGYVTYPSASSYIYNALTGEEIKGQSGQRIYFEVTNGCDIPNAGKRLFDRLWLAGHGWLEISAAGSFLKRSIVDNTVWQSNRFDFAAGASCERPLEQRRGDPVIVPGAPANLLKAIPPLTDQEEAEVSRMVEAQKMKMQGTADRIKERRIEEQGIKLAGPKATDDQVRKAKETIRRAIEGGNLMGDYPVTVVNEGKLEEVKVLTVLENPEFYHGLECLDPVEPEYDGARPVGKLFLLSGAARIHSFAHGGRTFKLCKSPGMIEIIEGRMIEAIDRCLDEMRKAPEVFEHAERAVTVGDKIHPIENRAQAFYWLAQNVQFFKRSVDKDNNPVEKLLDPPLSVCSTITEIGGLRGLKVLRRICSAPTVKNDGRVSKPGYDSELKTLFNYDEDDYVLPDCDYTIDDALKAAENLFHPFRFFPFVDRLDRSIMLSAILTAIVRPVIETAPAHGFDAPAQGSGKTLLAKCIGAIGSGKKCEVFPHTAGRDDEEIRKRVLTILMSAPDVVIWDNIIGTFNSAALAGLFTARDYVDRLLGKSENRIVPNISTWIFTGNNMSLAGDMPRRVLKCRIDPKTEEPYAREFDFDPESYCLENRAELVMSGITLVKCWINAGKPHSEGKTASFEEWDELVRQPVAWLETFMPEMYQDPIQSFKEAQGLDPERQAWFDFLNALYELKETSNFTVKELYQSYERGRSGGQFASDEDITFSESVHELMGSRVTSMRMGKYMSNRVDLLVNGMSLKRGQKVRDGVIYRVDLGCDSKRDEDTHYRTEKAETNETPF